MLKNKKAVYLLVPLNLLIWGFFVYRFYTAFTEADAPVPVMVSAVSKASEIKDSATYTLGLDYKDPFLKDVKRAYTGNSYNSSGQAQQPQKSVVIKPAVVAVPKELPDIKYLGLIKNNTSGLTTALVSLNGQSKLIKQNESSDGITFKTFNKDSLVAKWGKERIVVRK